MRIRRLIAFRSGTGRQARCGEFLTTKYTKDTKWPRKNSKIAKKQGLKIVKSRLIPPSRGLRRDKQDDGQRQWIMTGNRESKLIKPYQGSAVKVFERQFRAAGRLPLPDGVRVKVRFRPIPPSPRLTADRQGWRRWWGVVSPPFVGIVGDGGVV